MARELTSVEDYRAMLAGAMPEEDLLVAVETEATLAGWRWHHIRRADLAQQQGDPGWPDFVAIRAGRIVVAELKAASGRVEAAQQAWLDAWTAAGAEVYVWRPADLARIREVLR
jgi:hypothetical protein